MADDVSRYIKYVLSAVKRKAQAQAKLGFKISASCYVAWNDSQYFRDVFLPREPGELTQVIKLLASIRDVPDSNLFPWTDCPRWRSLWFFSVPVGECCYGTLK
jgi:hypothetical protein